MTTKAAPSAEGRVTASVLEVLDLAHSTGRIISLRELMQHWYDCHLHGIGFMAQRFVVEEGDGSSDRLLQVKCCPVCGACAMYLL